MGVRTVVSSVLFNNYMLHKEVLLQQIIHNFHLSPDEAEAALLLLDTRAANLDMSLDDYMQTYHPAGFSQKDATLNNDYKGYVQFLAQDAKAIIKTGKTADFSTFVHENAHIFRRQLAGDLKAKAERAFKVEGGNWTREQEEYFAIGFEEYIRLRMAASEDLRQVFERGARCMQHIYNGLDRIVELNPEIIKVYDELFTESRFQFNQKRFEKTIDTIVQYKNETSRFKSSHVYLGMTPPIYQELGFERLPVMITAKHLQNVMAESGQSANINYHGLSSDMIKQIPEAIKKPLIIMQSQKAENREDIIAVIGLKDKNGKQIIIPFSPNKKGYFNNVEIDINLAKTIYGRTGFNDFLIRSIKENRILYINKKSRELTIPEIQFLRNHNSQLLYDNIARYQEIVKQKISSFAKLFQAAAENIETGKKINRDTFYSSSYTDWHEVKTAPNREPDFRSGSYSEYWYTKEGVYRKSNHWGNVSSCKWPLDGQQIRGDVKIGFSKWSDFYDMDVPFKSWQEAEYDRYTIIAKKRPFDFEEQRQLDIRISKKMLADAQKIGNEDRIKFLQEEIKMYESLNEKDFHAYKQPVWETLLFQTDREDDKRISDGQLEADKQAWIARRYYVSGAKAFYEGIKDGTLPAISKAGAEIADGIITMIPHAVRYYTNGKMFSGVNQFIAQKYAKELDFRTDTDGNIYVVTYHQAGEKNLMKGQKHFPLASHNKEKNKINYYNLYSESALIDKTKVIQMQSPYGERQEHERHPQLAIRATDRNISVTEYLGKYEAASKLGAKFITTDAAITSVREKAVEELSTYLTAGYFEKVYDMSRLITRESKKELESLVRNIPASPPEKSIKKNHDHSMEL